MALLLGAACVWLALFFDANSLKPRLIQFAQEQYSRKLDIKGDLGLSFFPGVGIVAKDLALSEPDGVTSFASLDKARAGVSLWPLLSDQLVIDSIELEGVRASVMRGADGRWNFDNLIPRGPARFKSVSIDKLAIRNANIRIVPGPGQPLVELTGMRFELSPVAAAVPAQWAVDGKWALPGSQWAGTLAGKGGLVFQSGAEPLALSDVTLGAELQFAADRVVKLDVSMVGLSMQHGRAQGLVLAAGLEQAGKRVFALRATSPEMPLDLARVPVQVDWSAADWTGYVTTTIVKAGSTGWQLPDLQANAANLQLGANVTLGGAATLDTGARNAALRDAKVSATFAMPKGKTHVLQGTLGLDVSFGAALSMDAKLAGTLDQSPATLILRHPAPTASVGFTAMVERVNLDGWLANAASSNKGIDAIDLAPLRALPIAGVLTIGTLQSGTTTARNVRIAVE